MFSRMNLRRLAVAGAMSLFVGCGPEMLDETSQELTEAGQEIVGGTATTIGANPWQVSLQDSTGFHFCGGSVINASWILTAQHCVTSGAPARIEAGTTTISGSGQIRTVAQLIKYPGYVDASKGKDVALLRLSTPLDLSGANVKAIGLVTAADATAGVTNAGVVSRITGWGTLSSGGSSPDTLQTADVNIVSNTSAQSSYPSETITADQLAAAAPGKDTCQGDSGGPLTVLKSGTRVLAGVTSWGYGCADARYPGMYARVSSFESWINSQINAPPPTTIATKTIASGATGTWNHTSFTVPSGTTTLTVTLVGGSGTSGDADLYVRSGSQPTTSLYNCRPYLSGNNETCTISAPVSGTWYMSVYGYSAYSNVTVTATRQ
jgi:secreted trypsin-like serine protease